MFTFPLIVAVVPETTSSTEVVIWIPDGMTSGAIGILAGMSSFLQPVIVAKLNVRKTKRIKFNAFCILQLINCLDDSLGSTVRTVIILIFLILPEKLNRINKRIPCWIQNL